MNYALISIIGLSALAGFWFGWSVRSDTNWKTITADIQNNFEAFKNDVEESINKVSNQTSSSDGNDKDLVASINSLEKKVKNILNAKHVFQWIVQVFENDGEKQKLIEKMETKLPNLEILSHEQKNASKENTNFNAPSPEELEKVDEIVNGFIVNSVKEEAMNALRKNKKGGQKNEQSH